jgi:hypothetical protein
MISRVWHGWTSAVKADAYEELLEMWFNSLEGVRAFAGDDYRVPEKARRLLSRFDERSQHHEVRADPRA